MTYKKRKKTSRHIGVIGKPPIGHGWDVRMVQAKKGILPPDVMGRLPAQDQALINAALSARLSLCFHYAYLAGIKHINPDPELKFNISDKAEMEKMRAAYNTYFKIKP